MKGKGKTKWMKGEGVDEDGLKWGWNIWKLRCKKLFGDEEVTTHAFIEIYLQTDNESRLKEKIADAKEEMEKLRKGR